jgi:hypothetical protein
LPRPRTGYGNPERLSLCLRSLCLRGRSVEICQTFVLNPQIR